MPIPDQIPTDTESTNPARAANRIRHLLSAVNLGPALPIAAAVLFLAVWAPRFVRSFWVDEAGTFWMVHDGLVRALARTWHWPGQSLLYSAIASFFCLGDTPVREVVLRLPSLIGIAAAAIFLFRIAEQRIGYRAGAAAVILFLFHPGVIEVGFQARPYALGMAAVAASCWALSEWETSRSRKHLLWYAVASILVVYLHYFFSVILAVHAAYLSFVFFVQGRRQRWRDAVLTGAGILLSVAPLLRHLQLMVSERQTVANLHPPAPADLANFLAPSLLLAGMLLAGCLLSLVPLSQERRRKRLDSAFLVLMMTWWLLGPVVFLLMSRVTAATTFIPRYLSFSFAAQALLFTAIGFRLFGDSVRVWSLAAVLLFAANPLLISRLAGRDELLPVIRLIRTKPTVPVFFPSLLLESVYYDWRAGNQPNSYLFAPLVAYPIENPVIPLPFRGSDEGRERLARQHISDVVDSRLRDTPEVLFVDKSGMREGWIRERMEQSGFKAEVREVGDFTLYLFHR